MRVKTALNRSPKFQDTRIFEVLNTLCFFYSGFTLTFFFSHIATVSGCLFVLRFYGPVNPMGSCQARSVYLTTPLLGRLSPLSG